MKNEDKLAIILAIAIAIPLFLLFINAIKTL